MKELADILEENVVKPARADGTRWVDHRKRALGALAKNYPTVVAHLNEVSSQQRPDIRKEDAAKAKGWLKKLQSFKFVWHTALYTDMLTELSSLSLLFQRDNVNLPDVVDGVRMTQQVLNEMSTSDGPKVRDVIRQLEGTIYKGVNLTDVEEVEASCGRWKKEVIKPILQCLNVRFESFTEDEVLNAVTSLDPKNWPEDLAGHGDEEVKKLLDHFQPVLSRNNCDVVGAISEWQRLRRIIRKYYRGMPWNHLWERVHTERRDDFANILHLIKIIQVIPLATAKVERAFSVMGRVKSDWRVNLDTLTLDDLLQISLEGPTADAFKADAAVTSWWKAGKQARRPHTRPYGKRSEEEMPPEERNIENDAEHVVDGLNEEQGEDVEEDMELEEDK